MLIFVLPQLQSQYRPIWDGLIGYIEMKRQDKRGLLSPVEVVRSEVHQ